MNINATETNGFIGFQDAIVRYINSCYIPYVQSFAQALPERILLNFGELLDEAEAIRESEWKELNSKSYDEETISELAMDKSVSWLNNMQSVKQSLINLHAVGLSHIFEQQLYDLSIASWFDSPNNRITKNEKDRRSTEEKKKLRYADFQFDKKILLEYGKIDIELLSGWDTIKELRDVCNVIKHAEGRSGDKLKKSRPVLFENPALNQLPKITFDSKRAIVRQPLSGDSIFLKEDDIKKYAVAIETFWNNFNRWVLETA
jgi:hypothetical protein